MARPDGRPFISGSESPRPFTDVLAERAAEQDDDIDEAPLTTGSPQVFGNIDRGSRGSRN